VNDVVTPQDPVYGLLHPRLGLALPFEWSVAYAPDGDPAATVRRAWAASRAPAALLFVAQNPTGMHSVVSTPRVGWALVAAVVDHIANRAARRNLRRELATPSAAFEKWYHRGHIPGWVANAYVEYGDVLQAVASLRYYVPTHPTNDPLEIVLDRLDKIRVAAHAAEYADVVRAHLACPTPEALGFTL